MVRGTGISISVDPGSLTRVKESLRRKPELLLKQVAGALNDTAKHSKSETSKLIREKVTIQKRDLDRHIYVVRAYPQKLVATVVLEKTERLSLKYFGARQTKKGVTYRIAKAATPPGRGGGKRSSSPKERIPDAFGPNIPRLGGNVFVRKTLGGKKAARLPIRKLHGPSAWGVFIRHDLRKHVGADAKAYLANRIKHRIQYQVK